MRNVFAILLTTRHKLFDIQNKTKLRYDYNKTIKVIQFFFRYVFITFCSFQYVIDVILFIYKCDT